MTNEAAPFVPGIWERAMSNYFDHNAKSVSWDLIDCPDVLVTETELTKEERERWNQNQETPSEASALPSLPAR